MTDEELKKKEGTEGFDFMNEKLMEDCGKKFYPARYVLRSKNDVCIQPYKTYKLFFEETFYVHQKLGIYESIGTPDECRDAVEFKKREDAHVNTLHDLYKLNDPIEPMKVSFALRSELMKYELRKKTKPEDISPLDITIIHVLDDWLKEHDINPEEGKRE